MATYWTPIWATQTARFTIRCEVTPERDSPAGHFDDDGETAAAIEAGRFDWFAVRVRVLLDHHHEVGSDYLSGCCYRSAADFACGPDRDGYFRDMVRVAISEARAYLRNNPHPRLRAA